MRQFISKEAGWDFIRVSETNSDYYHEDSLSIVTKTINNMSHRQKGLSLRQITT